MYIAAVQDVGQVTTLVSWQQE